MPADPTCPACVELRVMVDVRTTSRDDARRERDEARAERDALQARLDALAAPVEGVDVEEVLRIDAVATPGPWRAVGASIRVTLPEGIEYQWATASYPRDTALVVNYRTAAPALAREVVALRAINAQQRANAEGTNRILRDQEDEIARLRATLAAAEQERDAACHALAICEGERDAWRAVARVAPAVTCAGCGKARTADPAASDPGPCPECGQRAGLAWLAANPLTVLSLTAERDELRLTLAAEQGEPEGAPSDDWKRISGTWQRDYPDGSFATVFPSGNWFQGKFGDRAEYKGKAPTQRAAMLAADEVKP